MKRILFKYAGLASFGLIVLCMLDFLYFHKLQPEEGSFFLLAELVILCLAIHGTVKSLFKIDIRKFWIMVGIGMLVSVLAGSFAGVFSYLYVKFLQPEFAEKAAASETARLKKLGESNQRIQEGADSMREAYDPNWQLGSSIVMGFLAGIGLAFVITAVVLGKTNDRNTID